MKTTLIFNFQIKNEKGVNCMESEVTFNSEKNMKNISNELLKLIDSYAHSIDESPYSNEVICTKSSYDSFTVGKKYKVIKGIVTDNGGDRYGIYYSLDEINDELFAQFIEYKGEA